MDALILVLGVGCTVYTASELLALARRAPATRRPRAAEASTGRPLTLRVDRRRGGRRAVDRRAEAG